MVGKVYLIAITLMVATLSTHGQPCTCQACSCGRRNEADDIGGERAGTPDQDVINLMQRFSVLHKLDHQMHEKHVRSNNKVGEGPDNGQLASNHPSIFCWSVVVPNTYEVELLRQQLANKLLSGCDGWAVYSNVSLLELFAGTNSSGLNLDTGYSSAAISGSMLTGHAGPWNSALNTPIFIQVWRHILSEGIFDLYDWTIKVDVDTVFLPQRVKQVLQRHDLASKTPIFIGNTRLMHEKARQLLPDGYTGLTGAVEILSRSAVQAYAEKRELCENSIDYHDKSEDWYLHLCLQKLAINTAPEHLVLTGPANPRLCGATWAAAYHPAKNAEDFRLCVQNATASELVVPPLEMVMIASLETPQSNIPNAAPLSIGELKLEDP